MLCHRRRHRPRHDVRNRPPAACRVRFRVLVYFVRQDFDKTSGRLVPFKLRRAQLKLVRILLCDLFTGKPVRIVLLKARQWGGSTVVQMFMAWIQLFHRSGWNSVIVADVEDQARTIRAMYSRMARRHPVEICSVQFCNFEGSSKIKCSSIGIVSSRSAPCRSLTASVRVI